MRNDMHRCSRMRVREWNGHALIALSILLFCAAAGRADLEIEEARFRPERPLAGLPVAVYAMVRNNGSEAVRNFDVTITLTRNGKNLKTISSVPVLSELPRAGVGLSLPVDLGILSEGDYQVRMTVDPSGKITENNESNNEKTVSFRVYNPGYAAPRY